MDSRKGYEYSYEIRSDNEIIPTYRYYPGWDGGNPDEEMGLWDPLYPGTGWDLGEEGAEEEAYLFEFRTTMKFRSIEGGGEMRVLGKETFGLWMEREIPEEEFLEGDLRFRVHDDYWMPVDQIRSMVRAALDFADAAEAAAGTVWKGVVVSLDVVTVQQEGESAEGAYERAIKPENFVPMIPVWVDMIPRATALDLSESYLGPCGEHLSLLRNMRKRRVEEEAGLAESCGGCGRRFVWGSQVSFLPCLHKFHPRCLFEWVNAENSSCPSCALPCSPVTR